MLILSPAKINLALDVLGKDERSGNHFVNTILCRDDALSDELVFTRRADRENRLWCSDPRVPLDASNTILKALDFLDEYGWDVRLTKRIPVRAGLGGGSSNAGVVLKHFGMQKGIPEFQLMDIAQRIGSDVPFFVQDERVAYFEGFGDQVVQSWQFEPFDVQYVSSGIEVSSSAAYSELNLDDCGLHSAQTEALIDLLSRGVSSLSELSPLFHNDFETGFFSKYPSFTSKGHLCGSGGMLWRLN